MTSRFKPLATAVGFLSLMNPTLSPAANNDWIKGVSVDGLVEVEAGYEKFGDEKQSDIVLATAALGFTGKVHEWSTVRLSFLYEQDVTPLQIDESYITLGNLNVSPLYLKVGQVYLPFGRYETQLISDPVTYDLADTLEQIAQVGFESGGAYGSVYAYNGETLKDGGDDMMDHYGATLGFAKESENLTVDVGVDYINDFGDLLGPRNVLTEVGNWAGYEYVNGIAGHANLSMAGFTIIAEYLSALDQFTPEFLPFENGGAEPKAWYAELGYTLQLGGKEATFALSYQATEDAVAIGLPKECYLGGVSVEVVDNTSISLEYKRGTDYETSEGGTGEDSDAVTMQVAVEF